MPLSSSSSSSSRAASKNAALLLLTLLAAAAQLLRHDRGRRHRNGGSFVLFVRGRTWTRRSCRGNIRHVRIASGRDASAEMIVSFASKTSSSSAAWSSPTTTQKIPVGAVVIGTSPEQVMLDDERQKQEYNHLVVVVEEEPATFYNDTIRHRTRLNDTGTYYYSPYYHHVVLRNLEPSTTYYYRPVLVGQHQEEDGTDDNDCSDGNDGEHGSAASSAILTGSSEEQPKQLDEGAIGRVKEESVQALKDAERRRQEDGGDAVDRRTTTTTTQEGRQRKRRQRRILHRHQYAEPTYPRVYDAIQKQCPSPDKVRSFRTAPRPAEHASAATTPVTFAILGDLGQTSHSVELMSSLLSSVGDGAENNRVNGSGTIDAILMVGDLAYAMGDPRKYDCFLDFLDDYPVVETIPFHMVPGNQDIEQIESDGRIFQAYEHRFRMPRVRKPDLGVHTQTIIDPVNAPYPLPYEFGNAYYSFTYGPAHIIMISSYSSVEPDSMQYRWMESELKNVDRSVTPWVLAVMHVPIYNAFAIHQHDTQVEAAKQQLEPLFVKYSVNVVFSGHVHAYLRTCPVAFGQVDPKGPLYITVGDSGEGVKGPFKNIEPEPWVELRDGSMFGYGAFRIENSTTAIWNWTATGQGRYHNRAWGYHQALPPGPESDSAIVQNQYFL